ncbi:hypothetical protein JCM17844_28970 [Iodidimonas gelatinilytica]|uniref:Phosphoenolpyruvate-protein phosphotransferase n=1 Tax=Iodidimonas gelatinilytica TaxID=1236966 RepID=A0A5A7MTL0_9PROT|nr:phosphoenolpyruvate--protein phosphotransferase [Iodidimonas gelatinilytica]GEQ99260.1 hypothetical protein JCM17844_28970 [Iodidimonas gelatinilytica]
MAEDVEVEKARLIDAFETMRQQIDRMIASPEIGTAGEHREILETFKMFAYDRGWQKRIFESVDAGLTAEAAVERVQQQNRRRMASSTDPYLRERLSDLDDLTNRLLRTLAGRMDGQDLHEPSIILARTMGPAELLDYDRTNLAGIILEEGSSTSHVAILARAMGIPLIGRCRDISEHVQAGDRLILDGDGAQVLVRPSDEICETYSESIAFQHEQAAQFRAERNLPSITRDGVRIQLFINAGLQADMAHLDALGADGVGLFRTEFQFMVSATLPRLEAQQEFYKNVLDVAQGRPVVFRTLDIGGDKAVPFLPREDEENPAMGWRAIRIALERPVLLRYQLRALMAAAAGRTLSIMFPMIADMSEFKAARNIALKELARFERLDIARPAKLEIGTMLEVPSLAWQLDPLLKLVDFVSIGTNDLMQFFFASDRSNPRLTDRYDLLSPPALSFIRMVVKACDRAGVPVTLCGEMGGRPLEAMALIGLGLRRLSISPMTVGPVRRMIRSLNVKQLEDYILDMIDLEDHSLRVKLRDYARDHLIEL